MKLTKIFHLILALSVILFFVECKNNKYQKEIAKIDSLKTVLNKVEKKLTEIDTNVVHEKYKKYKENMNVISVNYSYNKKDLGWNTICQYGKIEKPLRDFSSEQGDIKKELKFSRKQLDSLKFDIQNGNIEKKEMSEFIESESDAVAEIVQTIKITNENTKTELNRFDTLNPKIEIIIKKIKKK
jgi:hypothetical protein